MRNLNAITPETAKTTHYYWAQAHDFDVDDNAVSDILVDQVKTAFLEDKDVFEAQQANIDLDPEAAKIDLSGDVGGEAARKLIRKLIEAETEAANPD